MSNLTRKIMTMKKIETTEKINISALSIGDWVQARMTKWDYDDLDITPPMRVVKIEKDGVVLSLGGIEHPAFVDDLQPIPITPEILEKNGFRQSKRFSKDWQLTVYNDEVYINLGDRYTSCEHNRMVHNPEDVSEVDYSNSLEMPRPMFVHELQRFMQLANVDKDIEV